MHYIVLLGERSIQNGSSAKPEAGEYLGLSHFLANGHPLLALIYCIICIVS